MSKIKNLKNEVKSKIEAVKKINDNPKASVDKVYDKYLNDLPSSEQLYGKKLDDFLTKRKKKIDNRTNIFEDLVDIADSIITNNRAIIGSNRMQTKSKIKQHALDAADKVLAESKNVVLENVKKIFFAGDGICGANKTISEVSIEISPKEFDLLNYLTIDPSTAVGKVIYESPTNIGKVKLNTELYSLFSGGTYTFTSLSNNDLFDITWDSSSQKYLITGFTNSNPLPNVEEFLNDYYSTIELPDLDHIIKTAMLNTIQGDGSDTPEYILSINLTSRALNKIFSFCSRSNDRDNLVNQTPVDFFDENDQDPEFFFDFDDVEGIDLDDEDTRYRKVLKFVDCDNFEVNNNPRMINDFVYIINKKNINDSVNSILNRAATDAFSQSNGDIPEINFNLSLLSSFIFNIPKAIAMSVLSPKILLGVVIIYKMFKSGLLTTFEDIKTIIKNLSKLFFNVISELFWIFVREFWKLVKPELLQFVSALAATIIANKFKRYTLIVTRLISLLTRILENGIDNCEDLYSAILNTIDGALNADSPITIPNLLLAISDSLPGYSQDRAYINIIERMEAAGINTGPLFGEENKLPSLIKSIIDGNTEEIDTNSFVKVVLKPGILPGPSGGAIITPATFSGVGKMV